MRVSVATDVKAAAAAEARWGSLVGCDPGLYVNLGTGLAAALVVGGQVVAGSHGAAGEIAYNLRRPTDVGRATPTASCWRTGSAASRCRARRPGPPAGRCAPPTCSTRAPPTRSTGTVLQEFVAELCFHVVNLVIALDPARVSVGGGMVRSWDVIGTALQQALDAAAPYPPELVVAAFPHDAALLGALALGVDGPRPGHGRTTTSRPWPTAGCRTCRSSERVSPHVGSTGEGQSR